MENMSSSTEGVLDKSKVECYKCHKLGHFARECRGGAVQQWKPSNYNRNTQGNTTQALVSQESLGFDWSDQAEECVHDQALMAEVAEDAEIPNELISKLCTKACLNTVKKYREHNQ